MWKKNIKKKMPSSKIVQCFLVGEECLEYTLIRDAYKTLRLRVKTDASIEVKAPKRYGQVFIDAFLQSKADWIRQKRQNALEKGVKPLIDLSHEAAFFCLGKEFSFYYSCMHAESPQNISVDNQNYADELSHGMSLCFASWQNNIYENKGQFLCGKEIFQDFLTIANNACKKFTITNKPSGNPPAYASGKLSGNPPAYASGDTLGKPPAYASGKLSGKPSGHTLGNTLCSSFGYPSLVLYIKAKEVTNSLRSIHAWRKKTAELFFQVCLDRVWDGLCGISREVKQESYCLPAMQENVNHLPAMQENVNHLPMMQENDNYLPMMQENANHLPMMQENANHFLTTQENGNTGNIELPSIPKDIQAIFRKINKPHLRVRVLSRRFGSCSSKGEICLACHLIAFPLELIESVIIHECCHLVYMNHSKYFYNLLNMCCVDARKKRELLLAWSSQHPNF